MTAPQNEIWAKIRITRDELRQRGWTDKDFARLDAELKNGPREITALEFFHAIIKEAASPQK
jgi:hypothetical protein